MNIVGAVIILWIIPIVVAISIGRAKHRFGFLYGFFLGWLGVLILAVLPSTATAVTSGTPMEQLLYLRSHKDHFNPKAFVAEHARLVALIESERECPFCKEQMKVGATVCPHCHRESQAVVA